MSNSGRRALRQIFLGASGPGWVYINLIGKESNKIDEVEFDEVHDPGGVLEQYSDPKNDPFTKLVIPILRLPDMKRDDLA